MDGEELHLLVNHWPSRRGGPARSAPKRMKAARVNREIIAEINSRNEDAKILIMGDFNDDPTDDSLIDGLLGSTYSDLEPGAFYNPMIRMHRLGWNTLVYRDRTNLFDQILLSYSLVHPDQDEGFRLYRAAIFNPEELIAREGKYRGYPFRSFQNGKYSGGYSDHYPVYVELIK
jgi:predicted extracellular nuclease